MNQSNSYHRPNIAVVDDPDAVARAAADLIATVIRGKSDCVLGLATGGTPVKTYQQLIRLHREDGLDFAGVTTFNLDEYVGLAAEHEQSYRTFMQANLFDHINIPREQTHVPDGVAADPSQYAESYERAIVEAGGIDLQLLGIGHNGHIAFNEPGSAADSRTRVVDLTDQTISKNARFFASAADVPRTAITMGIGTILEARQILLLAMGTEKAEAVARAMDGAPDPSSPASLLQHHANVTFIVDREAASLLRT